MIILSVDYGDKRTGIAVCDKFEMLASPVCVITEWNIDSLANKIIEVAKEKRAEEIWQERDRVGGEIEDYRRNK